MAPNDDQSQSSNHFKKKPENVFTNTNQSSTKIKRVPLPADHWQMSAADCTQGLGRDYNGNDIAAMVGAGWQVCI